MNVPVGTWPFAEVAKVAIGAVLVVQSQAGESVAGDGAEEVGLVRLHRAELTRSAPLTERPLGRKWSARGSHPPLRGERPPRRRPLWRPSDRDQYECLGCGCAQWDQAALQRG